MRKIKKQTTIYLSDEDQKKLAKIKETYGLKSNGEILRYLLTREYMEIIRNR